MLDAIVEIHRVATDAGLLTGIHAGDGKTGRAMAQLGFQMITLAAESQALRRGAVEHLREANGQ
jgi:2-keto-3-deoxy-L-rhamnonate aldolase RhmA